MTDKEELPIGFMMELSMHPDILSQYALLPENRQKAVADQARQVQSRQEMRNYVESLFRP